MADKKEPAMDKLYYYVRRMDSTLRKSTIILNELEAQTKGAAWKIILDLAIDGQVEDDEDESNVSDIDDEKEGSDSDEEMNSEGEDENQEKSLAQKVVDLWNKRRESLVTDLSIAGWMLSPIPEIYNDAKDNYTASIGLLLTDC